MNIGIILVILLFVFLLSKNILFATTTSTIYVNFRTTIGFNEVAYTNNCGSQLTPYKYDATQATWSGHTCSSGMTQSSVFCGSNPQLLLNNLAGDEFRVGGAKPSLWKNTQQDVLCICDDNGKDMAVRRFIRGTTSITTTPNNLNSLLEISCVPSCIESWSCSAWSSCSSNQQTRNCIDSNNCGTAANKPVTTQSCSSGGSVCGNGICESGELIQCITTPCNQPCPQDCSQVCTQEAGQLCNPTTKQLISYINGCQKSDFLNQGYTADLSICNQNQQVTCITNPQLLTYISTWVNNQITNSQLLSYITSWVNC